MLIALAHALLAGWASSTKSATYDEPMHLMGAYLHWQHGDFRVNPEHPALWHNLIMMSDVAPRKPYSLDFDSPAFGLIPFDQNNQWLWLFEQLNGPKGIGNTDYLSRLQDARWRSSFLFGGALVLFTGFFLRDLLRSRAQRDVLALLGATFVGFDANFLAHAPLVTNDVAITAAVVAMTWAGLRVARGMTLPNLVALALATGVATCIKFTGVVIGGGVWIAIVARVMAAGFVPEWTWRAVGRETRAWSHRVVMLGLLTVALAVGVFGVIWASYGFRFAAIRPDLATATQFPMLPPDHPLQRDRSSLGAFNFDAIRMMNRGFDFMRREGRPAMPQRDAIDAQTLSTDAHDGAVTRAVYLARELKLIPESYLYGFYYAYVRSKLRGGFVAGEYYNDGRWYYYPLAILFKTPTATLVLFGVAGAVGATSLSRRRLAPGELTALLVVGLPAAMYFASAITSGLNIGVRHVLVIYPAVVGLSLAALTRRRIPTENSGKIVASDEMRTDADAHQTKGDVEALASSASHPHSPAVPRFPMDWFIAAACGLTVVESVAATPDFIPFFNVPSRVFGDGGVSLLADSNLDWGQDLPALAAWQRENPDRLLYLCYFGTIDPAHYGIRFVPFGEGFDTRPAEAARARFDRPGVVAISATNWQGVYASGFRGMFKSRTPKPFAKVGGSIFLFDYTPKATTQATTQPSTAATSNPTSKP